MASRASDLWHGIREEILRMAARNAPDRVLVDSIIDGRVKIKELGAPSALGEEYARLAGFKLPAGAKVLTLPLGDKRIILGEIQNTAPAKRTFDTPIEFEELATGKKGFNSPVYSRYSQNSADTATNSSTSVWVTNFDWDWTLPAGTWDVYAETDQMLSHTSSGSTVRGRTTINGTAGTDLSAAAPGSPIRSMMPSEALVQGCSGTITIAGEYRPNGSASATAGGGRGRAIAFRTS